MTRLILGALALAIPTLAACSQKQQPERYGFVARLGNDTVSVASS